MPPSRRFQVEILGDAKSVKGAVKDTEGALGHLSARGRVVGQGFSVIGTGLKGLGVAAVGFGITAGVALGAAAKSVVSLGISYQDQLNNMQAVTHSTDAVMGQVAKTARALGNDLSLPATSAVDAAQAMTELAKGGLNAAQAMQAAKGTLQLAAAAQVDGATAAGIQANALNAFSLKATEAGKVADALANTANAATGDIGDFALGLAQSGAVAHQFGISLNDTLTALGEFANAGIKGSDAGTSLKSALLALASPSAPAAKALKILGVNAYDARGQFVGLRTVSEQLSVAHGKLSQQAFNSAVSIAFGSDAARVAGVLAKDGAAGFDKMSTAVGQAGGAAQVAASKMRGVGGALQGLQSQVETVKIDVFSRAAPSLEAFIRSVSNRLPAAADAGLRGLDRLFGAVQTEVPKARAKFAEFGPQIKTVLSDKLHEAGEVATNVFAPAMRGAGTVLHAVLDEAVSVGHTIDGVFTAGVGAAGKAARGLEVDSHSLADAVHEVGASINSVAQGALPVLRFGFGVASESASALFTTVTGATKALGPFAGAALAAAAAVKVAQLAMLGWGSAAGVIGKVTGAYSAFGTAAALKVGLGVERASVALGSTLPAAATRGTVAMSALSGAFAVAGPVLATAGAAFLANSYTQQKNAETMQRAAEASRQLQDATRDGGQAAIDAHTKQGLLNAQVERYTQQGGIAADLAGKFGAAVKQGSLASDQAFGSLSAQDAAAQGVTRAQNDLTLAISKYGVSSTEAQGAANILNDALRHQKALQDDVATATQTTADKLANLTQQVNTAATAANSLNQSEIGVKQTQLAVRDAQEALNKAIHDHGKKSGEAQRATLALKAAEAALEGQSLATAGRARDLAIAQDRSGNASHAAGSGAAAYRGELIKLRDQAAPGSALRKYLQGLIGDLDRAARPRTQVFRFQTVGSPPVSVRGGGPAVASIRDAGGPVTRGEPYLIGLNRRPEVFIPNQSGRIVPLPTGSSSGGGGAGGVTYNITNIVAAGADPAAVGAATVKAIQAYEKSNGKSWRGG